MLGPAGTGKTTLAKAFPGILPPLSQEEALAVTRIYSSIGQVPKGQPLIARRPVRMPHHTSSGAMSCRSFPAPCWKPCASPWKTAR
jgi:magnesium chelatase family protein